MPQMQFSILQYSLISVLGYMGECFFSTAGCFCSFFFSFLVPAFCFPDSISPLCSLPSSHGLVSLTLAKTMHVSCSNLLFQRYLVFVFSCSRAAVSATLFFVTICEEKFSPRLQRRSPLFCMRRERSVHLPSNARTQTNHTDN